MKTSEDRKIIRTFELIVIWTLFAACTVCGLVLAYEKTAFVSEGQETQTFVYDIKTGRYLHRPQFVLKDCQLLP